MSRHSTSSYIPLTLAIATLLAGFGWSVIAPTSRAVGWLLIALSVLLFIVAGILAYKDRGSAAVGQGSRGGAALAVGDGNIAVGGRGGDSNDGPGGSGGNAIVYGNNSVAKGGDGGSG